MNIHLHNRVLLTPAEDSPFYLANESGYREWRQRKLDQRPALEDLLVQLDNPFELTREERDRIVHLNAVCNMAIYKVSNEDQFADKKLVHQLGLQLGLSHLDDNLRSDEDDITSIEVREQQGNRYIPYTNRPLSWHADGYYNEPERQVRGFIVHCVNPAAEGGISGLIDHELLYIRLRDENPEYIQALMRPGAMTIPPNIDSGTEIRGACVGPVFSVDADTGSLHMRYSARKRNIEWRDDELTRAATALITKELENPENAYIYKLNAGEGLICNNVLHKRDGFQDSPSQKRLIYRARYYDRISNTGLNEQEEVI
jgi:alpha-ketoglutarate-dependent taurine dioxygenase